MTEENNTNLQGYNIVTILKRLEAATSRLEDITIFQHEIAGGEGEPQEQKAIAGTPAAIADVQAVPVAIADVPVAPAAPAAPAVSKSVTAFEEFLNSDITPFVETSASIDPIVKQAAEHFQNAFNAQVSFLDIVSKTRKPDFTDAKFAELLTPINQEIAKLTELKDSNRKSAFFNHLNTLSEGAPVVGWIVTDTPVSFIPEFKDTAQFWANRILKEYKEKDPKHATWVKEFLKIFEGLKSYVKEYHTTGAAWNPKGSTLEETLKNSSFSSPSSSSAAAPAPSAGGPPPPPPPPPPPSNLFEDKPASGGINAVFADLNKGEGITSGLKKVDRSQMTHKNPSLREQPAVGKKPTPPKKPSSLSTQAAPIPVKKPAKKELIDGSKWIIENFTEADVSAQSPIVIEVEMTQSVFIGNCSGVTIQIKGKANAISVTDTSKCGIVIDSLISGIDIIKSFKFGLQVVGTVYMISVDKSDEGNIYLSKESAEVAQIFTSSTTTLNVNVPENDDYTELAIPEQLKHTVKNGKLISEVVEHAG